MIKKKLLAFGASNSRDSINKKLAAHVANQVENAATTLIDLNDFEMPIFSIEREKTGGIPAEAKQFKELIESHDGIVVSFAEHNGNFSAAFKNIFDWVSRLEGKVWAGKPMFLLATSPGGRGGISVLEIAKSRFPYSGGEIAATFSLPSFKANFSETEGVQDEALNSNFREQLALFANSISAAGVGVDA